jgi:hypothetical protein
MLVQLRGFEILRQDCPADHIAQVHSILYPKAHGNACCCTCSLVPVLDCYFVNLVAPSGLQDGEMDIATGLIYR